MTNGNLNRIANCVWGIADDVLRGADVRGKYREVILPMTVIRRVEGTRRYRRSGEGDGARQIGIQHGVYA